MACLEHSARPKHTCCILRLKVSNLQYGRVFKGDVSLPIDRRWSVVPVKTPKQVQLSRPLRSPTQLLQWRSCAAVEGISAPAAPKLAMHEQRYNGMQQQPETNCKANCVRFSLDPPKGLTLQHVHQQRVALDMLAAPAAAGGHWAHCCHQEACRAQ
jgi:hypothetical protein